MGRSVSVPGDAFCTAYIHLEPCEDEYYAQEQWDDFIEDLRGLIAHRYPSFETEDRWAGRETQVILENLNAAVAVCEYCGLVSVSLVSRPHPLAQTWCRGIEKGFLDLINSSFGGLRKIGTGSNGEAYFQQI